MRTLSIHIDRHPDKTSWIATPVLYESEEHEGFVEDSDDYQTVAQAVAQSKIQARAAVAHGGFATATVYKNGTGVAHYRAKHLPKSGPIQREEYTGYTGSALKPSTAKQVRTRVTGMCEPDLGPLHNGCDQRASHTVEAPIGCCCLPNNLIDLVKSIPESSGRLRLPRNEKQTMRLAHGDR